MIPNGEHERPASPGASVERLKAHMATEGFKVSLDSVGNVLKTWTCHVIDPQGQASVGRGKGVGDQATASAIAEALEHHRYGFEDTASKVRPIEFHISAGHSLAKVSPDFLLLFGGRTVSFDCLPFDPFRKEAEETLWFPAILQNPGYQSLGTREQSVVQRSKIYRYATNTGTAAGLTIDDASLHGLLEAIERDAIGLTLLRAIIAEAPQPVRRVDLLSLPAELGQLVSLVERESDASALHVWDITTDTGVATLLCSLTIATKTGRYRYFGSGTSLMPSYALARALLEALQGFHIHQLLRDFEQPALPGIEPESMSLYRRCGMDAGLFEHRAGEVVIKFESLPTVELAKISDQISYIVARLHAIDCPPFRRSIYTSDAASIVQVLVPNLDRFYLVARGIAVAPSWRGRRLLASMT